MTKKKVVKKKVVKPIKKKTIKDDLDLEELDEEDIDLTISEPHMEIVLDNGRDIILRESGKLYIVERYRTRYGVKYGLRRLEVESNIY